MMFNQSIRMRASRLLAFTLVVLAAAGTGCDVDSFVDPSNLGRWENTPVVLPILERLDVIDEPLEEIPGLSDIRPDDLVPEITQYTLGPGDVVVVTVFGLVTREVDSVLQRTVDELGNIDLPVVGLVNVEGKTTQQVQDEIVNKLKPDILQDPIVTVVVFEKRQSTFTIFGTREAGPYTIIKNNFRLLDAIALGGGLPPDTEKIYVVRQVSLTSARTKGMDDTIAQTPAPTPARKNPVEVLEELAAADSEPAAARPSAPPATLTNAVDATPSTTARSGRYVNVGGKWVEVYDEPKEKRKVSVASVEPEPQVYTAESNATELVSQRVIEIDAEALMRGEAKQNIAIRPNDIIRVPDVNSGFVFIEGAISRPGSYAIPGNRKLTLTALIASAGGLDPVAIPERVDLYRRIGKEQQAIVRLNLRAIAEGVQPNIFLKPHDEIRIGTNIYASFLAVIRNSFRMSYGFGFLLDRNFGNDVFGPPPVNRFFR